MIAGFRRSMAAGVLALALLLGPWLVISACATFWRAVLEPERGDTPESRVVFAVVAVLMMLWAVDALWRGRWYVRRWWLLFCSLFSLVSGTWLINQPAAASVFEHWFAISVICGWSFELFRQFRHPSAQAPPTASTLTE